MLSYGSRGQSVKCVCRELFLPERPASGTHGPSSHHSAFCYHISAQSLSAVSYQGLMISLYQVTQVNLIATSLKLTRLAKALLPCKITYSQGPGIRTLTSSCVGFGDGVWGGVILPTTVEKKQWDWVRNPGLKWGPGIEILGVFPSIHCSSSSGVTHNSGLEPEKAQTEGTLGKACFLQPWVGWQGLGNPAGRCTWDFPYSMSGENPAMKQHQKLQISKHRNAFF